MSSLEEGVGAEVIVFVGSCGEFGMDGRSDANGVCILEGSSSARSARVIPPC